MVNTLRNNEYNPQDLSGLDLNQPEFVDLIKMADDFCSNPGLGEKKSHFEKELSSMSIFNLYDLYMTRTDLGPGHDAETTNLRARQIEKALLSYIENKGIDLNDLEKLQLSIHQMDDIYISLKEEYIH